jgi:hypothetical protein
MFFGIFSAKNVTVEVPSGAAEGSGKTGSLTGATVNWGNGFRGGGWDSSAFQPYGASRVNSNINLTIETYAP